MPTFAPSHKNHTIMKTKFYLCTVCGNVTVKLVDSGVTMSCCGKPMLELVPSETDGLGEKHLPVVEWLDKSTLKVKVGSIAHPMTENHRIMFIYLETEHGGQIHYLKPGDPAEAVFHICGDKPVAVYEYCNVHGLWKSPVKKEESLCNVCM